MVGPLSNKVSWFRSVLTKAPELKIICFRVLDIRFLEDILVLLNSSTNMLCSPISLLVTAYTLWSYPSSNNSATLSAISHSVE